jgi:hypothetical protein
LAQNATFALHALHGHWKIFALRRDDVFVAMGVLSTRLLAWQMS